jgi:hypothetical protein
VCGGVDVEPLRLITTPVREGDHLGGATHGVGPIELDPRPLQLRGLKGSKTLVRWPFLYLATSEPTESARAAARNR